MKRVSMENLEPKEIFFKQPWGKMAGLSWGKKGGETIILIHGLGDNAASFLQLAPLLAHGGPTRRQRHLIALDLGGHGRSDPYPPSAQLSLFTFVTDLRRVMLQLPNAPKVTLICHSIGGQIGLYLASAYPQSIENLILIDPFVTPPANTSVIADRLLRIVELTIELESRQGSYICQPEEAVEKFNSHRFFKLSPKLEKVLLERSVEEIEGLGMRINGDPRLRLLKYPLVSDSSHLALVSCSICSVLVIASEICLAYKAIPQMPLTTTLDALGERLSLVSIQGSHFIHYDDPLTVVHQIEMFLHSKLVSKL